MASTRISKRPNTRAKPGTMVRRGSRILFKVQRSIRSSDGVEHILIYDREEVYVYEGVLAPDLAKFLTPDRKSFYWGYLRPKAGVIPSAPRGEVEIMLLNWCSDRGLYW
jgi:hypothetical protein